MKTTVKITLADGHVFTAMGTVSVFEFHMSFDGDLSELPSNAEIIKVEMIMSLPQSETGHTGKMLR